MPQINLAREGLLPTQEPSIYYDSIAGNYVDLKTGECIPPDCLAESPKRLKGRLYSPKSLTFDEYCDLLSYAGFLGLQMTKEASWRIRDINPDVEIGQTVPWDEFHFEQVHNGDIEFSIPDGSPKAHRTPNCADIEHQDHPLRMGDGSGTDWYEKDSFFDSSYSEPDTPIPEVFEAIQLLAVYLKKNPKAGYWKWLPVILEFLVNHINLQDPSGEIGLPDLLSAFNDLRKQNRGWIGLVASQEKIINSLRQNVKQLRTQMYGHRKHKTFP